MSESQRRPYLKVVAGVLQKGPKVFAAQRSEPDHLAGLWEFPGGKIEEGETAEQALKRELFEELGYTVTIGKKIGSHLHVYDQIDLELHVFWISSFTGELQLTEHQDSKWLHWNQLHELNWASADIPFLEKITHALSHQYPIEGQ